MKRAVGLSGARSFALSVVALASIALPCSALAPPAVLFSAVDSGGNASSVEIDSTGAVTYTGACTSLTCPVTVTVSATVSSFPTCSSGTAVVGPGIICFSGTVGPFQFLNALFKTKPIISPAIDFGLGNVTTGATGGTLTVTFTDAGFNVRTDPVTIAIQQAGAPTNYGAWFDTGNTAFAETTSIYSFSGNTAGTVNASPTVTVGTNPVSLTGSESFTLGPNASYTNDFEVLATLLPISITCSATNSGVVGTAFSSLPAVSGGTTPYTFSVATGAIPNGITLNTTTGMVSGTATAAGSFTIQVTDANGVVATGTCPYTFSNAVVTILSSCVTISAVKGIPITSTQVTASGGFSPYTFSATGLPTGIVISSSGVLSGTPAVTGTFNYTVTITDSKGNTGTFYCSVTVGSPPPVVSNCSVINATQGIPITPVTLTASGGTGKGYTFTATGLPTGLSISSGGTISGTPTVSGTFNYVVTITDSGGNTGTLHCSITVAPGHPVLTVTCAGGTGEVGTPYSSSLGAVGGVSPYTFSIIGSLPGGLTLTSSSGAISGTPTTAGPFDFTAQVVDSSGSSATNTATAACAIVISPAAPVTRGDTATIGFWHNKNGQALILALNGGSSSESLANWLAGSFPYVYGAQSSNNLTNKTNAAVAALFLKFFGEGGQKTDAQILACALASYVTSSTLAGTTARSYGFNSSPGGTGAKTYNVGSDGSALGLVNNESYTVLQLLQQANLTKANGTYNANALNDVFDGINQGGDIS